MSRQRVNNFLQATYYKKIITKKEQYTRNMIVQEIRSILKRRKDYVSLRVIGSSAYNLVIDNGDIDLVLLIDGSENSKEEEFCGEYTSLKSDDDDFLIEEEKMECEMVSESEEMDGMINEIKGDMSGGADQREEGESCRDDNCEDDQEGWVEPERNKDEYIKTSGSEGMQDGRDSLHAKNKDCTVFNSSDNTLSKERKNWVDKEIQCNKSEKKIQKENRTVNFMHTRSIHISEKSLYEIANVFKHGGFDIENILINATFPIIKLKSKTTNVKIDLSLNQYSAIENTNLIAKILSQYPFIRQTIVLVKTICGIFNINCSYTCTLSSYAITLMTIFYFQITMDIPHIFSKNKKIVYEYDLFDNVRGFFFFYGWVFNFKNDVVSVRLAKLIKKTQFRFRIYNEKYNLFMCVEDPIVSDFNVTRTVTNENVVRIVKIFRIVFFMLSNYNTSFL